MAAQERDPRAYELMTVFLPELADEDSQAQLDRVSGYITSAGGTVKEVLTSSPWGRRRLAYTIRFNSVDYRDGIYTVYHFDAAPTAISDLERDLKLDTSTMRYLLVHDDPKTHQRFDPNDPENVGVDDAEGTGEAGSTEIESAAPARRSSRAAAPSSDETSAVRATEPAPSDPADASPESSDDATGAGADENTTTEPEESAEALTDDAVSAEDEPLTVDAPEQLDADSTQVPISQVVDAEDEADTAPDDKDEADTASVAEGEADTASDDEDAEADKE